MRCSHCACALLGSAFLLASNVQTFEVLPVLAAEPGTKESAVLDLKDEPTARRSSYSRVVDGLVLRVTIDAQPDPTGAIWCDVVVENVSREVKNLPIHMYPQFYWLSILLKDKEGRELPYSGIRYKVKALDATFPLARGRLWGRRFNLRQYFVMDKKGKYSVAIRYGEPPIEELIRIGPINAPPIEVVIDTPERGRGSRGFLEDQ
jgi:hypothetical protein